MGAQSSNLTMLTPSSNRGRRFTHEQRTAHNLHGRVPSGPPLTLVQDVSRIVEALDNVPGTGASKEIVRYEALMHVLERDETLFFAATQMTW